MEFPFISNYRNYPRHHWAEEETPAMNPHHWAWEESPAMNRQTRSPFPRESRQVETPVVNRQTRSPKAASKVVEIPVRFVGSVRSEAMKVTAAVKIQKVFRGLLVRKCVKKIAGIRKEVDEIEKKVSEKETILMIRRDAKERLKVNEMLMKLLLQLDSIRGVDSGVRVFRKSVIKKAIMLQERVDEIVSGDVVDTGVDEDMKLVVDSLEPIAEVVDDQASLEIEVVDEDTKADNHVDSEHHEAMVEAPAADHTYELQQVSVQSQDNSHIVDESLKEEEEDLMDIQQQSELIPGENTQNEDSSMGVVEGGGENGSSNRDLMERMERMIKGNEMLTGLVAELCERQESQTRLISSLSQRVENLEKAFRSERSKRKKKRNNNINKL